MLFFILEGAKSHTVTPVQHHFRQSGAVTLLVMTAGTKLWKNACLKSVEYVSYWK
jgi:hypothetical protein